MLGYPLEPGEGVDGLDLADASLVAAAESLRVRTIFTLDLDDFSTYRVRRGRALQPFEIVP